MLRQKQSLSKKSTQEGVVLVTLNFYPETRNINLKYLLLLCFIYIFHLWCQKDDPGDSLSTSHPNYLFNDPSSN